MAVDHLVALGHRRIAHIDGAGGAGARRRQAGYAAAMKKHGLGPMIVTGSYTEEGGAAGVRQLLETKHKPTAIFAANDLAALGALQALAEAGRSVPEDVSLVGYDNGWLAGLQHISLTTIDQPRHQLGATAVELLIERLDKGQTNARHLVLAPSLVVRATTGPRPAACERTTSPHPATCPLSSELSPARRHCASTTGAFAWSVAA